MSSKNVQPTSPRARKAVRQPIGTPITKVTRQQANKPQRKASKGRFGLVLAGGGPLGAVYEIGALAAIEEAVAGLDLNEADIYVGISAGGIIAAGLANGVTPHEMCKLFIESDTDHGNATLFKPELLLRPAWAELQKRVKAVPGLLAGSLFHYARGGGGRSIANSFGRITQALPAGILSGEGINQFLAHTFKQPGRTNDFRKLRHRLVLVATDLDSGESIRYGQPGFDDVPISRAAQASAAVPGLFPPVEINGRHVIDGVLRKTLHASIALEHGVDILFCVNPIVPYNAKIAHGPGKLSQGGLLTVLSQTLRAIIHSRVARGIGGYAVTYPDSDILLFEPDEEDAEMFFTNLFSTANRRRMCENAYQSTRALLWKNRAEIEGKLARHGMHLKLSVLRDKSLTLVGLPPTQTRDRFGINKLRKTLAELEHKLKVAGA